MTYKSKISSVIAVSILCLALVMPCLAQRKITPVKSRPATGVVPTAERKKEDDKSHLAEMRDAQGNVVFVDTITGMEWVDSTANEKSKKMIYPRMESLTLGVNVWDPAMRLLGSDYGGFDVSAELSLYNRYKPVIEFGIGASDITPDGQNYTFHTPLSPYFKIGINYNFLFNSNGINGDSCNPFIKDFYHIFRLKERKLLLLAFLLLLQMGKLTRNCG